MSDSWSHSTGQSVKGRRSAAAAAENAARQPLKCEQLCLCRRCCKQKHRTHMSTYNRVPTSASNTGCSHTIDPLMGRGEQG